MSGIELRMPPNAVFPHSNNDQPACHQWKLKIYETPGLFKLIFLNGQVEYHCLFISYDAVRKDIFQ